MCTYIFLYDRCLLCFYTYVYIICTYITIYIYIMNNLYLYININLYVHEISILVFFHFPCCFSASLQTFFDRGLRLSLRSCGDQAQLGGRHFSLWSVVGSSFVFLWLGGGVEIFRLLIFFVFLFVVF